MDNRVFKDMPNRVLNDVKKSEDQCKLLLAEVMDVAAKSHPNYRSYTTSLLLNRLISIIDICNYRNEAGDLMHMAKDIFNNRATQPCYGLCCKSDALPIALKGVSKKWLDALKEAENSEEWLIQDKGWKSEVVLDAMAIIEEMEALLAKLANPSAPVAKVDHAYLPYTRAAKRRGVEPATDDVFERTQKLSRLWEKFRVIIGSEPDPDTVWFSYPFTKVENPPAHAAFASTENLNTIEQLWKSGSKSIFPLITGILPQPIGWSFANAFAEICASPNNYLLFARSHLVKNGSLAFALTMRDRVSYLLRSPKRVSSRVSWNTMINAMEDDDQQLLEFNSFEYRMTQVSNFGFEIYDNEPCNVWKRESDGPVILTSLLEHVCALEGFLQERFPVDSGLSCLVDLRASNAYLLNGLFFVDVENVCVDNNCVCTIVPALSSARLRFPRQAFVAKNLSSHKLLCNNLALFFYYAVTGNNLPEFSVNEDDEDGVFRSEFARKVNTITVDRRFLDPMFVHLILCLYVGDCNLRDPAFKSFAHQALLRAFLYTHEAKVNAYLHIKELQSEIGDHDQAMNVNFDSFLNIKRPQPGSDWVQSLALAYVEKYGMATAPSSMPNLRIADEPATGIGPHREIMVNCLLDLCRHDTFYLEIDTEKRKIVARKNKSTTCRVCQANKDKDDPQKCIVSLSPTTFAIAQFADRIVLECLHVNAALPVIFGMSAIAAVFSNVCPPETAARLLLSERSTFARKIADSTFEQRNAVHALPASVSESRLFPMYFPQFEKFRAELARLPERAAHALYTIINRVPETGELETDVAVNDLEARIMVASMITVGHLSDTLEFCQSLLEVHIGKITSYKSFETAVASISGVVENLGLTDHIALFLKTAKSIFSVWALFGWVCRASRSQLEEFLRVLGIESKILNRCKRLFFSNPDNLKTHLAAIECYNAMVQADDKLLVVDLVKPKVKLNALRSNFWLAEDLISVMFDADSNHMATVATCTHTITLPVAVDWRRINMLMEYVLASKAKYSMA